MPSWVVPPAPSTGNVIASAWGDAVVGDLQILQTQGGLYGQSGGIAGIAPAVGTPQWLTQGGLTSATATSGNFSFAFPTQFPNGLLTLQMQAANTATGQVDIITVAYTSCTKAVAAGQYFQAGAGVTGAIAFTWFAIGW